MPSSSTPADASARLTMLDGQMVELTDPDRKAMIEALSSPPKPTKSLRDAFERYQARFGG